jgi:hypothetical protein
MFPLFFFRQNDAEIRNLFSEIEKLKGAFEFVERPTLVKPVQSTSSPKDAPKDTPKCPVRPEEKQDPLIQSLQS